MESFAEGHKYHLFDHIKVLYKKYFVIDDDLVFCNNIGMLMTEVNIELNKIEKWGLTAP